MAASSVFFTSEESMNNSIRLATAFTSRRRLLSNPKEMEIKTAMPQAQPGNSCNDPTSIKSLEPCFTQHWPHLAKVGSMRLYVYIPFWAPIGNNKALRSDAGTR